MLQSVMGLNPYEVEIPSGKRVIYYSFDEEFDIPLRGFIMAKGVYANADYFCLSGNYWVKMDKFGEITNSYIDDLKIDLYDEDGNLLSKCVAVSNCECQVIINQLKSDYNLDVLSKIEKDALEN